jgi:hypothetical protein
MSKTKDGLMLKTAIEINGTKINLKGEFKGTKDGICGGINAHHVVTVSIDGKWCSFDYWLSQVQPLMKDENDLIFALYCFVGDALCVIDDSYDDFCSNLGYEPYNEYGNVNKESKKVYKGCLKALDKLNKFDIDLYTISNELQEKYDC